MTDALRHEEVPRNHTDGTEHREVAYALSLQHLDQLSAISAEAIAFPYPSRDHPRTVSSSE
jgi:hypothetical protein